MSLKWRPRRNFDSKLSAPKQKKVVSCLYRGVQEYEHLKPVTKLSGLMIILAIDSVFKARWSAQRNTSPPNTHSKLHCRENLKHCVNSHLRVTL